MRFAKDFGVPLTTSEITTVWKKGSTNHQPHDFEQFQKSIGLLGFALNRSKQEKLTARQKVLKKELKRRKELAEKPASEPNPGASKQLKATALEKMTNEEIQGELLLLPQTIGRLTILTED